MQDKKRSDLQTVSLFLILGALTLAVVLFFQLVVMSPQLFVEMATK